MPKYKLPKLKKGKNGKKGALEPMVESSYARRVRFPANGEIIKALAVGKPVTVTVEGVVCSVASSKATDLEEVNDFEVEINSVEAYAEKKNTFSDMVEDD